MSVKGTLTLDAQGFHALPVGLRDQVEAWAKDVFGVETWGEGITAIRLGEGVATAVVLVRDRVTGRPMVDRRAGGAVLREVTASCSILPPEEAFR